jgi:hypothetical protein
MGRLKTKKVIIPASVQEENDAFHAVSRKFKHLSLPACVPTAVDSLIPLVLTADSGPNSL